MRPIKFWSSLALSLAVLLVLSGCNLVDDVVDFNAAKDCQARMIRGTPGVNLAGLTTEQKTKLDRIDVYLTATATAKPPEALVSFAPPPDAPPVTGVVPFHCVYVNGAFAMSDRQTPPKDTP